MGNPIWHGNFDSAFKAELLERTVFVKTGNYKMEFQLRSQNYQHSWLLVFQDCLAKKCQSLTI